MPSKGNMPVPPKWSGQDKRFGETIKSNLDVLCGYSGDPLDRALTARDLLDSGIAKLAVGSVTFSGGSSGLAPATGLPVYDAPPAPTSLAASGAFQNIILSWNLERYQGHSYVEVYRHTSDVIADAILTAQVSGSVAGVFSDFVGAGADFYYWVRAVNDNGVVGPFNSSTGTRGQTAPDVDFLLDALEGEITESELATDLQGEIDKISGGINVAGSIAAQVASEATARGLAISAETTARGLAISAEATARGSAISAEATARSSAISAAVSGEASARASAITASADAIQSQINDITGVPPWNSSASYSISDTVHHDGKLFAAAAANSDSEPTFGGSPVASTNTDWTLTGDYVSLASVSQANSASITAINNISTDSSSAAAVAIKGLQTSKEDTGVAASAVSALATTVADTYATSSEVTSLETAVFNDMTGVAAWSSSASYSVGDKVISGKKLYRATDSSTDVVPPNSSYWAVDTLSSASAVSELSTTLTDDYQTASATNLLLAGKETSGAAAQALSDAKAYADDNFATSSDLTAVETAVFNDMTGVADWNGSTTYAAGDKVISGKKLYRATDTSTDVEPPNGSYWVVDTLSSASAVSELSTTLTDDYQTASATNLLLAGKETSGAAATALSDAKAYADDNFATSSDLTAVETAVFNDMTGVADWNGSTTYAVGDKVISGKKLYRAIDASTDVEPPSSSYWAVDTLSSASAVSDLSTTLTDDYLTATATNLLLANKETAGAAATALSSANAYADANFATSSELTNLESATFGNLTGLSAYNENTSYSAGDRVTHGDGAAKKIYIAIQASNSSNKQAPTVTAFWDEDTIASQAVTNAALNGKETSGAAAQALQDARTYTDTNAASASEFSALNTALFEDVAGVNAWVNTTFYDIGDRIYHNRKIYRSIKDTEDILTSLPTWNSSTTYAVDSVIKYTNSGVTLPYKSLISNSNSTPHNNISGDNPKWAIATVEPTPSTNGYWALDPVAAASALTALDAKVTDDYALSSDVTTLESALFNDLTGVADWSSSTAYAVGDRAIYGQRLYRAIAQSSNVTPPSNASKWVVDTVTTSSALSALETEVGLNYALASNLTTLESSLYSDLIGVSAWVGTSTGVTATNYSAGDFVTHDGKLWKALAASTNVEPSTTSNKWEQDTLTTADQVESAYAKSSDITVLQSNVFNSMTGVDDWNSSTSYAVSDRVVYTQSNGVKKLYRALIANSNTTPHNNISGENPKWALDTIASALVVSALDTKITDDYSTTQTLNGQFSAKEDAGTAAALLTDYRTSVNQDSATTTAVDAAYSAIFSEMTGLPDWDASSNYAVGDRVVHRASSTANRKVYKALLANSNSAPHLNFTGSSPKWELDTLAFAGALTTLDAVINADNTGLVDRTTAVELRIDDVGDVTMEQQFTAQANAIGDLESQYTVKIDANGAVAGFGLASTTTSLGTNESEFYVNADRFAIMRGGSDTTAAVSPFVVQATATTLNGETVPAGVYMTDAFIRNGSIVNAQIANAAIDDAKISDLTVNKITGSFADLESVLTGTLDADNITTNTLNVAGVAIQDSIGRIAGTAGNDVSMGSYSEVSESNFVNASPHHIAAAYHSNGPIQAGSVMGGSPLFSFNFTTFNFTNTRDFVITVMLDPVGSFSSASSTGFAFAVRATTSATAYTSTSASDYITTRGTSRGGTGSSDAYILSDIVTLAANTQYYIWVFGISDDVSISGTGARGIRDGQISVMGLNR